MRSFVWISVVLFVCSCASPYQPSEESLRIQQSLTEEDAMKKLVSYMSPTPTRAGLCAVFSPKLKPVSSPTKIGTSVSFLATQKIEHKEPGPYYGSYMHITQIIPRQIVLDLRRIDTIRIHPASSPDFDCQDGKQGYWLLLHSDNEWARLSTINIEKEEIHGFVAAIRVVQPRVEIFEGLGF